MSYLIGRIAQPGDVFIVCNIVIFGAYFLGVLSPHLMTILKARVSAAVIYKRINMVAKDFKFHTQKILDTKN
jgi:hypothetical protein